MANSPNGKDQRGLYRLRKQCRHKRCRSGGDVRVPPGLRGTGGGLTSDSRGRCLDCLIEEENERVGRPSLPKPGYREGVREARLDFRVSQDGDGGSKAAGGGGE